ncbi:MAG: MoaD/ThiS family protein [Thermoplasmata archaeon]|nr:MAG: MoaD/ThiS family protein [Thermoplasmata archaeon]
MDLFIQKFNQSLFYYSIGFMRIKVALYPEKNNSDLKIKSENATVLDVLTKLNIKPDTVIVMRDSKPIPVDDNINDGDKLKIIKVASGG